MSGPISVKFEASEDTLVISEAVSSSFGFFRALFGGDFKESAERTVTLKEISRPIAGVVLQARNDVLRSVTRENVLDCVAAIDYLEPTEESKLLDDVGKKVLRNRWHGDQDLCRAMLDMAFKRPLVRCLLQRHSELMQACAPYMVKNAAHVASHWTASGEEGNDGSMKGFVIAMLTCLKEQIDTGTCVVRLEILKRFLTEATGTTNFNEAAAVIFETQKMADEREIGVDTPGSSCSTWSGGIGVQLGASSCTCPRPHGSISTRDRRGGMGDCLLPLSECRALEVYVDPSEAHPTQGVLCCSCSFGYSIPCGDNKTVDEDAAAVPMDHIDPHTDQCMPMFYLGMLGSEKTSGLNQAFPFDHHDDFDYRDGDGRRIPMVEVHDINATATIRDLPMRSLALHCLRLMILEGKWDQVGQMGAAITTEVSDYMAAYLAHIEATGVSPLRVLMAWLGERGREEWMRHWAFREIVDTTVTLEVLNAHQADIAPFIRVLGRLGPMSAVVDAAMDTLGGRYDDDYDDGRRLLWPGGVSSLLRLVFTSIAEEQPGSDEGGGEVGGSGRPLNKRRRVEL